MSKNVQMPTEFLVNVLRLTTALERFELDAETKTLCKTIEKQIEAKLDAMNRRKTFTEYKTAAAGSEEREQRRREYLDLAGVHPDWQSTNEMHS